MEFGSALSLLLRRWLVVLVGAALTLGAAAYVYTSTAATYRATANLLLVLPNDAAGPDEVDRGNPFLYLPDELNVLARVVSSASVSRSFQDDMESRGLTSPYEVGLDPTTPVINVGVEGPDPANVLATRNGVVKAIQRELRRVQKEEAVPARQLASVRVFAAENRAVRLGGTATRGVIAVIAAGGLITLLAAFGIDRILEARRGRSRRSQEADASGPDAPAVPIKNEPAHERS